MESENEPRIGSHRSASDMRPLLEELWHTPGVPETEDVDADGKEDANEVTDVEAPTTTASVIVHHEGAGASVQHGASVGGEQYIRGEKEKYPVDQVTVEIVTAESYSEEQERSPSPSSKSEKLTSPVNKRPLLNSANWT